MASIIAQVLMVYRIPSVYYRYDTIRVTTGTLRMYSFRSAETECKRATSTKIRS